MPIHYAYVHSNTGQIQYTLDHPINKVKMVRITDVKIPITYYNVTSSNNSINLVYNNILKQATIPVGMYDIDTLVEYLNTNVFTNEWNIPVTVSYNQQTGLFDFSTTNGNVFSIHESTLLGFTMDSVTAQTTSSNVPINLTPKNLYFEAKNISVEAELKGEKNNILYYALINVPHRSIFLDSNRQSIPISLLHPSDVQNIKINIINDELELVDFRGTQLSFCIEIHY